MALKNKFHLPWIADFRDPWTKIDFYNDLHLSWFANHKHHRLEKLVVTNADCVVSVGNQMREEFEALGAKKSIVITNGFDTADELDENIELDPMFTIAHFGTVNKARNPELLWVGLSELVKERDDFARKVRIKFVGRLDQAVQLSIEKYKMKAYVEIIDFLPHKDVIRMQRQSQVLLLLINQTHNAGGILTGKFFEYLAAKRPILAIGPVEGDVAAILKESQAGQMVDFTDKDRFKSLLLEYYDQFKLRQLSVNPAGINRYSRYELTRRLAEVMESL